MRKLILLIVLVALAAWRLWPLPDAVIPTGTALPEAQAPAGLRFALIKTGEATTLEAMVVADGGLFRPTRIGHIAVLVEHPQGRFLFDAGLGTQVDQQFGKEMSFWAKPIFAFKHVNPAITQLQAAGKRKWEKFLHTHQLWRPQTVAARPAVEVCLATQQPADDCMIDLLSTWGPGPLACAVRAVGMASFALIHTDAGTNTDAFSAKSSRLWITSHGIGYKD